MIDNLEELENKIKELEAELAGLKKYGLVWDPEIEKEKVVVECENKIPLLVEDCSKALVNGIDNNILIEGDNFHSLTALNYIYNDSIDLIYIDPPYNTGHEDFAYNDKFINDEDGYKHSKWLSFMKKRLVLSRNLLKDDGFIFISIDDHEQANLKLLCDSIFGESNFLANIMVKANPRGRQSSSYFAQVHDYLLVYRKAPSAILNGFKLDEETVAKRFKNIDSNGKRYEEWELRKRGAASKRSDVPNLWYPIYFNPKTQELALERNASTDIEITPFLSDGSDGRWRWGRDKFLKEKNSLYARKNSKGIYNIYERKYVEDKDSQIAPTIWDYSDVNTELGTEALKNTTSSENGFDYPKPVGLIKRILELVGKKDALVLDFFAGSGTTGQAVLEMNNSDGGTRRFILCTNNENKICENITYQRLKTVITGLKVDGSEYQNSIKSNLYYFKTDFLCLSNNEEQTKYNLAERLDSLLCILENCYKKIGSNKFSSHYKNDNKHLFIYNDLFNEEKFNNFKDEVENTNGCRVVYIYTNDLTINENLFDNSQIIVKPIPLKIYEIYKNISEKIKRGELL